MTAKYFVAGVLVLVLCLALASPTATAGQDKPSSPIVITLQVPKSPTAVFEACLKFYQLKPSEPKDTYEIDPSSNKDLGKIVVWEIVDTGGFRNNNTGYRIVIDIIKDSDSASRVRVAVDVQQRTKHRIAEKWGKSSSSAEKTASVATELKTELGAK